jgi:carboxymethylenebutenolidase
MLLGGLLVIAALVLVLAASIAVDAGLGRGRVAGLTNTQIPRDAGDPIAAYVARPTDAATAPRPAVLMLHEFWGIKADLTGKADALAAEGVVVVAPDMFRGRTTTWLPRAIYLAVSVPEAQALGDLTPVLRWLQAQPDVDPTRIVVMGFCYGGGKALQFSLQQEELAGTGVFYGALESDPAVLARLPGPVLGIFGAEDQSPSPEQVEQFRAGLAAAGVEHEITVYPGVGHAFLTDMDAIRQGGVQGEAWQQFVDWLDRVLR